MRRWEAGVKASAMCWPPILTEIKVELVLDSPESPEKLKELYRLLVKWGTVISTLVQGLTAKRLAGIQIG